MTDRTSVFEASDKQKYKSMVPCNQCNEFYPVADMLASDREAHRYWSKKLDKFCPGKTCVQCTFELCRFEHHELGYPPGESPTLEDCWAEICLEKKRKLENRMSAHKNAYKTIDANRKADTKAGIFHFNKGSKKSADGKSTRNSSACTS